jgi:hypothetical protein
MSASQACGSTSFYILYLEACPFPMALCGAARYQPSKAGTAYR